MKEFKVTYWDYAEERRVNAILDTYYCSGEGEIKNQDMCINTKHGQFIVNTNSVIKLLKKHGRI